LFNLITNRFGADKIEQPHSINSVADDCQLSFIN